MTVERNTEYRIERNTPRTWLVVSESVPKDRVEETLENLRAANPDTTFRVRERTVKTVTTYGEWGEYKDPRFTASSLYPSVQAGLQIRGNGDLEEWLRNRMGQSLRTVAEELSRASGVNVSKDTVAKWLLTVKE